MADSVAALPPLRAVMAAHGIVPRRRLGQNFLLDLNLTARIVAAATGPEQGFAADDLSRGTVVEIGPGPGGLTRALLLAGARRVVAVERDPRCAAALGGLVEAADGRLKVVEDDALRVNPAALGPPPRRIIANLPYNIATPLLTQWLAQLDDLASMTLMFQREVADRLTAAPGTPAYSRLSVLVGWRCAARRMLSVPPRAFTPPPAVWSSVVRLEPRKEPVGAPCRMAALEAVTRAAFGQRRKMLRGALGTLGVDAPALLARAELDPTQRAETVDVAGFTRLAAAHDQLRESDGGQAGDASAARA